MWDIQTSQRTHSTSSAHRTDLNIRKRRSKFLNFSKDKKFLQNVRKLSHHLNQSAVRSTTSATATPQITAAQASEQVGIKPDEKQFCAGPADL